MQLNQLGMTGVVTLAYIKRKLTDVISHLVSVCELRVAKKAIGIISSCKDGYGYWKSSRRSDSDFCIVAVSNRKYRSIIFESHEYYGFKF